MKKNEIIHINHGIACRIGNKIFINSKLKKYPELYDAIMTHELKHSPEFTSKDILLDIENNEIKNVKKDYYRFVLTNPSSWTEFSPIWWYDGGFVINPLISALYLTSFIIIRFILVRI